MRNCSKCMKSIKCSQNKACWCFDYPKIPLEVKEQDCLCPSCLESEMATIVNEMRVSLTDTEKEKISNLKIQNSDSLAEGVDFTFSDKGLMILSRWYLLKRGYCCENACINCPY